MLSRRRFLGNLSAASVLAVGDSVARPAAGEVLSSIFDSAVQEPIDPAQWATFGRAVLRHVKGAVQITDGFAMHGEQLASCEFSFSARAPEDVDEVQIWAGIRCRDRDSRYVFALRGGRNDDLYLARYAPDGQSRFLGFAPLDFHPQPGECYKLRAVTQENRIQIYLNEESLPRLIAEDDAPLWHQGGVALGGGWLPAEFRDVTVKSTVGGALSSRAKEAIPWQPSAVDRTRQRAIDRSAYRPIVLEVPQQPRTEYSLDGKWLFLPDQELSAQAQPQQQAYNDSAWHVMDVPNFWTPSLTWLHGEIGFPELSGISSTKGIADRLWRAELKRLDAYTFDWNQTSGGWYRQHIQVPKEAIGGRFELCFDAIAKVSKVWVNGSHVGSHVGMFGEVRCDVTDQIHPGRNLIAVHVLGRLKQQESNQVVGVAVTVEVTEAMLNSLPHGMYREEAAGIWQPVKLVVTYNTWIEDVYLKPSLDRLDFELSIKNRPGTAPGSLRLSYTIHSSADGAVLFESPATQSNVLRSSSVLQSPNAFQSNDKPLEFSTPKLEPKLWSPAEPNLYSLELMLHQNDKVIDRKSLSFGFRTFQVRDGRLHLNGKPFWLRGANHFPHALRPNDAALAREFMEFARAGNVVATRSHTAPFSDTWLRAADEIGMAVSFEGTWPWLMLEGDPPSDELLNVWSSEFLSLIRKHRNHPSIVLWTVNNEMKFEMIDRASPERLRRKWEILSATVQSMRAADPTRPIVCDSSYCRKSIGAEYENLVAPNGFDDGDIDDSHRYPGWYDPSFFHYYRGEFGKSLSYPGRPLISQEMSTGYPRNDDGHPCRFYLFKHYTPQSLVGYEAYENRDPEIFLRQQAFITKELAEAIRRTNRNECSGILHFAYLSWYQDAWSAQSIRPFATYSALKLALQPILVSAELFGRHYYAGAQQKIRVCIANDAANAMALPESRLEWHIKSGGTALASGNIPIGTVPYYSNQWYDLAVAIPQLSSPQRCDAQLHLALKSTAGLHGENVYDIVVASKAWTCAAGVVQAAILDGDGAVPPQLRRPGIRLAASPRDLKPGEIAIITNGNQSLGDPATDNILREHAVRGGAVLVFNSGPQIARLFPDHVRSYTIGSGEIATMRVPESPIFEGLNPLDLGWWELGSGRLPRVCLGSHQVITGSKGLSVLAEIANTHGYLKQASDFMRVSGALLLEISTGAGRWVACELMLLESAPYDPIAGRLLSNLFLALSPQQPHALSPIHEPY
jgi:beta-galactosidase